HLPIPAARRRPIPATLDPVPRARVRSATSQASPSVAHRRFGHPSSPPLPSSALAPFSSTQFFFDRLNSLDPPLLSGGCRRRGAMPLLSPQGAAIPRRADLVPLEVTAVVDLAGSTVAAQAPIAGKCRHPNGTDGVWEVDVRDSGDDGQSTDASRRPREGRLSRTQEQLD
uniref:Uncharacterized protein n=2 Tax=Aegilops tauschii subsp. strangulata TaxID=200361 RepID=A0A452ZWB9_AEGTS